MRTYYEELYHYGVKGMKWGVINEEEKTSENQNKNTITRSDLDKMKTKSDVACKKYDVAYEKMSEKWYNSDLRKKLIKEDAEIMHSKYKEYDTLEEQIKHTTQYWDEDDGDILLCQGKYEEVLNKSNDEELNKSIKDAIDAEKEYEQVSKEYNSAVYNYYKDNNNSLKNKKELSYDGKVAVGTALAAVGGLAITSLGLYAINRNTIRTADTVRTGRTILAGMGLISAAIGFTASVRLADSKISKKG